MNTISKPQTQRVDDSPKPASTTGRTSQSVDTSSDRIDLEGRSGLLSQAQNDTGDDRTTRLEQLRALVQSGKYEVDSSALSQSIVSAALDGY